MHYDKERRRGIIKKVDPNGRLTLPKPWREILGIEGTMELNIFLIDENTIGISRKEKDYTLGK